MRRSLVLTVVGGLALAALPNCTVRAQQGGQASMQDVQRLQEDLANLDEDVQALDPQAPRASELRRRADEVRDDVVYLKVKMRRHEQAGLEGTGLDDSEVADLRRSIADLQDDIARAETREAHDILVPDGTVIRVVLDQSLSSRTAQPEERVEASVYSPVHAQGALAIPAGTRIRGIVTEAEPAERPSRSGKLALEFDSLELGRASLDLRGRVMGVGAEGENGPNTKERAGLGALLGGVVGGILGGRKGVLEGAVIGAGGAIVATKGEEVVLPAGTILAFELSRPLEISAGAERAARSARR